MQANLTILPGDGVGPEVTRAARRVLEAVAERFGHQFDLREHAIGGHAIDTCGQPLPEATKAACLAADAVLLGAVGGPKWSDPDAEVRPEQGLLALRQAMGVYANLRPVRVHAALALRSPLKAARLHGVDFLVVRELTGGAYFGARTRSDDDASDECRYSVTEIERVVRRAFELARGRSFRVTSVDKANVLETSRLWRATAERVALDYADVTLEHQLVDSMAMHLVTRPASFDVIVTENLFGDILTDEAAALTGSLGLMPSASLGDGSRGLYEPIHGSAPDIAGKGIANPLGAIASVAMALRHSLGLHDAAEAVEHAIEQVVSHGPLPRDLDGQADTASVTAGVIHALAGVPDVPQWARYDGFVSLPGDMQYAQ